MHRRDAQKVLRKALRPEWLGFDEASGWAGDARGGGVNNAERAAIAEAVLGMEVKRLNLAWLVVERVRSAYAESLHAAGGIDAFGVDALEEVLREHADVAPADASRTAARPLKNDDGKNDDGDASSSRPLPRARYVAAAAAMLDLHWMRERVVSNEFRRDRLAVLRGGAEMKGDAWPDAADARVAVAHSLPRWFAARLIEERGEAGAIALAAALAQKAPLTVRRNAIKCASSASLATALAREDVAARVPAESAVFKSTRRGAPDALAFESGRPRAGIFGLETYRRGWFEVQDAGSQCVVSAVTQGVEETCSRRGTADAPLKVLDACCGNGGKTLALASRLSRLSSGAREDEAFDDATRGPESYRIDCFDVDARRLRHLAAATRRAGCERFACVVTKLDLRAVASAKLETNKYDAVLVVAPCSSAGALRRFPSLRWEMEEAKTRFRDTEPSRSDDSERRAFGARGVPARRGKTSSTRDEDAPPRFYDDCNQSHLVDGDVASASGRSDRTSVRSFPATQWGILRDAAALVRVGGVLVYATCSVLRSENEDVAARFGGAFRETFEPLGFPAGWPAEREEEGDDDAPEPFSSSCPPHFVSLTPDRHGTDGFFIARWRRKR